MKNIEKKYHFQIRVTAVIISDSKILLVRQKAGQRKWSLPGGRLEQGESVSEGLKREVLEETGLVIDIEKLLYLTEKKEECLLHLTFLCRHISGEITMLTNEFDKNPISDVRFVPVDKLDEYGFSNKFMQIVRQGFPVSGNYTGGKANIGL